MAIIADVIESLERSGPRILSVRQICEMALQKIGAFSVNDTAADPVHLQRTAEWLDLSVQEFVGNTKCAWLTRRDISIPLEANKVEYDLRDAMGNELPPGGIIFPISCTVRNTQYLRDLPVDLIDLKTYEEIEQKDQTGQPSAIYIDRLRDDMKMAVVGIPTDNTYTLYLTVQQYAPDLTRNGGETNHQMRAEYQKWMVLQAAADVGNGPVRRLSMQVLQNIVSEAGTLRARLEAYANREEPHLAKPMRTEAWGA